MHHNIYVTRYLLDTMPNTKQLKMEDMSEAYLRALCAANGFSIDRSNHDNDGYDVEISCKGCIDPASRVYSPKLDIQLKSSYSKITLQDDGSITFSLEVKNYKTLIQTDRMVPQILVVFHMYNDEALWLEHTTDWLKITKCAYWISLKGHEDTENEHTININIPSDHVLTKESLKDIMVKISKQESL